ncbi:MAG: SRPBCC family protein [Woeseia sp.]
MKMKCEQIIQASPEFVWAMFDNPDNLKRWQPTLASYDHKSGNPGQPGAVSELVYDENGREVTMTETVTERREPHFLAGIYDNAWAKSIIVNHFEAIDENTTRFVSYSNMRFKGFMRIMSLFVAKAIRARVEADLNRFKLLVESEAAGNPS